MDAEQRENISVQWCKLAPYERNVYGTHKSYEFRKCKKDGQLMVRNKRSFAFG